MRKPTLFFDLDNTILDFSWAEARALSDALEEAGIPMEAPLLERYRELNRQCWELLEEGKLTRERVLLRRFELLLEESGSDYPADRLCDRYEHLLTRGHRFMPQAEETLRALQGKARLFVASNGSKAVQTARIASAGLERYFEAFFISEEMGENKPSAAYFQKCFDRIDGFDPTCAMMIGDSLTSDIRGGINAGIRSCWYNPTHAEGRADIIPDDEIGDLAELPQLLQRVFAGGLEHV